MQAEHFEEGLNDITFNFLITAFGVFEGRGWDSKPETNLNSLHISVLNDEEDFVNDQINLDFLRLILDGNVLGKTNIDTDGL